MATSGQVTPSGVTIDFAMQGGLSSSMTAPAMDGGALPSPILEAWRQPGTAEAFHQMLRMREQALASDPGVRIGAGAPRVQPGPPVVGVKDTFQVCGNTNCTAFKTVIATARYVGPRGAIFLDDVVPAGGFVQEDIDTLGLLFDGGVAGTAPNMYQIDTTAFGRESDIDGNGKVIFLLTDAVNDLSGSCSGGSVILGFFYGGDLLPRTPSNPGSNEAEIFFGLVPSSAGACAVSKAYVKQQIAPVFIHEFQHMISYNQHVLLRGGAKAEEVWLNEGLSHFAEELGGRLLGDGPGQGSASSRLVQFAVPDLLNANDYLFDPEATFLIAPSNSTGTLKERGAGWLFVRWLADHYATDSTGTSLTRQLVGTTLLGQANVEVATGTTFSQLIPLWQMANYLDNLPGFTPVDDRLQYLELGFPVHLRHPERAAARPCEAGVPARAGPAHDWQLQPYRHAARRFGAPSAGGPGRQRRRRGRHPGPEERGILPRRPGACASASCGFADGHPDAVPGPGHAHCGACRAGGGAGASHPS